MKIQLVIANQVSQFSAQFGQRPNLLLVAPNAELALNEIGIKVGRTYLGLTVIIAEIESDYLVALGIHDKS